jgi:phosphonate ABC transporter permease subunit PhnE
VKKSSFARTAGFIVILVIVVFVYAYGWQATDISLKEPQNEKRQQQVVRALRGLLSPELTERDEESQIAFAHFQVPCTDTPPAQPDVVEGQPYLVLTPDCGVAKDQITIEGFNYRRYSDGFVRWTAPGASRRSLGKVRTDSDGNFRSQLRVPSVSESSEPHVVEAEIIWPVGTPRPSEALRITIDGMIETVFLALMATSLGVVFAFPISFLAAQNLMRQIRTPLGGLLAALLPAPIGWVVGRWLLEPVGELALRLGSTLWLGIPILAAILIGLWFVLARNLLDIRRIHNPFLAGLTRYLRMAFMSALVIFMFGLLSGLGMQISLGMHVVLGDYLGGMLGNMLGTISELVGLMLPLFAGLAGILVLGSIAGTLLDALLHRVNNVAIQRVLGLVFGALAGGMLFYLVYRGIYNFYNPGEPAPYVGTITTVGAAAGGILGLVLRADYDLQIGMIVYTIARTILNILRSIEPLIMAIVFAIWVSIGPFAGVLALTLHSIAALSKLYSEQVESIDQGPIEAITATGATRLQTIVYAVVPQIIPPYIAFTLYRWDINVRMSTIIGFVGGGGIGQVLKQWIDLLQYRQAGVATLAIAIVVAALDYISAKTREKLV